MIKLGTLTKFSNLKAFPTHAVCVSRTVVAEPWAGGVQSVQAGYVYGTLDASGNFVHDPTVAPYFVSLSPSAMQTVDPATGAVTTNPTLNALALAALLGANGTPNATDPTKQDAHPKKFGDLKVQDIDTVAVVQMTSDLAGTLV